MARLEPDWTLDRSNSGSLYWRRDSRRVSFRYDVEVREFSKAEDEDAVERPEHDQITHNVTMGITAILCVAITVFLPWYIIGIN
ncbi:hypothetical protein FQA39_LY11046 [Lamprigera yunnana]|nr:hypothetical protein FQA39_LY11046 [Lamprigera yunnana]